MPSKLQSTIIRAPTMGGLNFEGEGSIRNPENARICENIVFDQAGRACSRKGFSPSTTIPLAGLPDIKQLHMMDTSSGNKLIFTANVSGNKIYESLASAFTATTNVTGALTPSGNNWQFVNFNEKVIGAQLTDTMISKTYVAGAFTPISALSGTVPDGNCVHSAFGRLWAQKGQTGVARSAMVACALLDERHWSTGAFEFNLLGNRSALAFGYDEIVAIDSFDNFLIVFMTNSITIFNNPDDPSNMGIEKVIQGVGCLARDSIQKVGDDILWLSSTGVRSLKHTVQSENNLEFGNITTSVERELVEKAEQGLAIEIKSAYFPEDAVYMLLTGDIVWAIDLHLHSGGGAPKITQFTGTDWHSMVYHESFLYIGQEGQIGTYSTYLDDAATYEMKWMSQWSDFGTNKLKSLKKLNAVVTASSDQAITFIWELDYGQATSFASAFTSGAGTTSEWNVAEWGLSEWSGSTDLSRVSTHASRTGEIISFGFTTTINNSQICIEELTLYTTLGRENR
jgi:hypothetical protein